MTCKRCGHEFCWLCGQDYHHHINPCQNTYRNIFSTRNDDPYLRTIWNHRAWGPNVPVRAVTRGIASLVGFSLATIPAALAIPVGIVLGIVKIGKATVNTTRRNPIRTWVQRRQDRREMRERIRRLSEIGVYPLSTRQRSSNFSCVFLSQNSAGRTSLLQAFFAQDYEVSINPTAPTMLSSSQVHYFDGPVPPFADPITHCFFCVSVMDRSPLDAVNTMAQNWRSGLGNFERNRAARLIILVTQADRRDERIAERQKILEDQDSKSEENLQEQKKHTPYRTDYLTLERGRELSRTNNFEYIECSIRGPFGDYNREGTDSHQGGLWYMRLENRNPGPLRHCSLQNDRVLFPDLLS